MKANGKSFQEKIPFVVFGSQYYRPPTPPVEEWEDDFKRLKELNFNTIKIWAQWRWVERKEEKYLYTDFDKIFDLADKYKIKVVPNTIPECPPEWIYTKYPECRIRDMERNIRYEVGYPAYQVGGFRPCWDHPEVAGLGLAFLKKFVERYKDRDSLLAWDVWNEPLQIFCSCENTHQVFTEWLRSRFETIEGANLFLGRAYSAFEEIPIPFEERNYPLMYLMYDFMADRLAEQIGWRVEAIKEIDQVTPVMTHSCGPGSSIYHLRSDDWKNIKKVDFYGSSLHQGPDIFDHPKRRELWSMFPLCLDAITSTSAYNWVSEIASDNSYYGSKSGHFLPEDIRMRTWTCIAHGAKGLLYWQFKPERLGPEAPGLGLIKLNGEYTDRSHEAKEVAVFVDQQKDFLLHAKPPKAQVGILWDPKINYMCQMAGMHLDKTTVSGNIAGRSTNLYQEAVRGAYQALWWKDIPCRIITPEDEWGGLSAICLPFPIHLYETTLKKITDFVKEGGLILSEGGLGSFDGCVRYSKMIPPEELSQVFGLEETEAQWQKKEVSLTTKVEIGKLGKNFECKSSFIRRITAQTAEPIAAFSDGSGALFRNSYGKGWAYYLATHPCISAAQEWNISTMELIGSILCLNCNDQLPRLKERVAMVNMRVLEYDGEQMLFVFNHENEPEKVNILVDKEYRLEVIRGPEAKIKNNEINGTVKARNVSVYHLH